MYTLIKNAWLVNEGKVVKANVLLSGQVIEKISTAPIAHDGAQEIDAEGLHLLPGLIDDQVHFREPGLTHKGNIHSESRAAVAGGITSFMEMPNTKPATLTQELLQEKYVVAEKNSFANYSFYMGASNDNLEEVLKTNKRNVCGVKVFMGSSTGNMLVDDAETLKGIFSNVKMLIATHCENDTMIAQNLEEFKKQYGENIPVSCHPLIRSEAACYSSSSFAVELAKKYNTRLHVLHISTARELELFSNKLPLNEKRITAEACVHHLWFSDADYEKLGAKIKWNPAVKKASDRAAILNAVMDGTIDVIATDHAPHTLEEKKNSYVNCPSGGPLVQHSLLALLELHKQGKLSLEKIVQQTSHNVAELFAIEKRGYIREGYYADLVLANLNQPYTVTSENILYHCGWSPFEGHTFSSSVAKTFVNGKLVYDQGKIDESVRGARLLFNR